jgi:hypothetical protein
MLCLLSVVSLTALCPVPIDAAGFEKSLPKDVDEALRLGNDFTLMGVDPDALETVPPTSERWRVLKRVSINDPKLRTEAVDALKKAIEESGTAKHCFLPRHAITTTHNGKEYTLVICFQCSQILVFVDGRLEHEVLVGNSAKAVLDKLLASAEK